MLSIKSHIKLIMIFIIMVTSVITCLPIKAEMSPNVLILNSYSRDFSWTDDQTQGFINTFKAEAVDTAVFVEYLDWKNSPTPENWFAQYQLFKEKYGTRKIDLIYTTDDAALQFAMAYRKQLFGDAPVVYSGVYPNIAPFLTRGEPNVTGIYENMDIEGTLRLMVHFNPKLETVYLLFDDTESGLAVRKPLETAVHNVNSKLSILYLDGPDYQTIIDQLRQLPDNSAVLLATYSRDAAGYTLALERYAKMFTSNSRVPVYILYDFEMGLGAVGGSVLNGQLQGVRAAQLGQRILSGESVQSILPLAGSGSVTMLDYQVLQRYKLPTDKIPAGSEVWNNPWSFYNQYKMAIWLTFSLLLVMSSTILVLMRNIRRRKTAERILRKNNEELSTLYEEIYASEETLQQQYQELEATQTALQKSQERYELSLDGANDGLWDWNIITDNVYFSDRCGEILGVKPDKTNQFYSFFCKIIVPEDRATVLAILEEHLKGSSDYYICEPRIISTEGQKWILLRGKALIDNNGQPVRMAGSLTDITERKKNERDINYLAYHDSLTGLANRTALNEYIQAVLKTCSIGPSMGALLFIDVDNFKVINDTLGHSYGDLLLIHIAQLLNKESGDSQFVARMGGDEFVVFLQRVKDKTAAEHYADSICALFISPLIVEKKVLHVTISMGVTLFPTDGATVEDLLKNADLAMYQAKSQGKNQYAFFDPQMGATIRGKSLRERNLRDALSTAELKLWYQAIINLTTKKISGFEALIRWDSPIYGLVMPGDFINIAEESGLIIPIGKKMFKQACCFLNDLHQAGYSDLTITVNISVVQLMQNDFVESIQTIIAETGVDAHYIGFEITESVLMESIDLNIAKLAAIKQLGITIYLDDFGTGYSSLKYLQRLPIDVIKIDKSFIDVLKNDADSQGMTKIIIELVHYLGLTTVAEGVETHQQLETLVGFGCDAVQGYFFSKPVPLADVWRLLANEWSSVRSNLNFDRKK